MAKSITIGSNGYLGRHLAHFLKIAGFENSNYDIQPKPAYGVGNYNSLDITDSHAFTKLNPDVDFIFMFAGLSGTTEGFDRYVDFARVNEIGLLHLLTWMKDTNCRARVVFPSSRLVYKGKKDQLLKEDDPKETRTIYAVNKLAAENLLWMYQNAFGIDYTVFRICVPYGNLFDNRFSYGTIGFFLSKALNNEDIVLFGDGLIRRTFTHVEDVCRNIIKAVQSENTRNEIYNIGGENLTLLEAAGIIASSYGVNVNFTDWPKLSLKLETGDTVFDDEKMKIVGFGYYQYNFKQWIEMI